MGIEETSTIDRMQKNRARANKDISPRGGDVPVHKQRKGAGCCTAFGGCTLFWWVPINYKMDLSAEG